MTVTEIDPTDELLTETDKAELDALNEEPNFHTLLEVWTAVLEPTDRESQLKPGPQWITKMIGQYPGVTFADAYVLRDLIYDHIGELKAILAAEISTDDQALTWATPEEDAEHNSTHYRNLLLNWQLAFKKWELEWDALDVDAAAQIAAIAEVQKMFFEPGMGMINHLDTIPFEMTDADRDDISTALDEFVLGDKNEVNGE